MIAQREAMPRNCNKSWTVFRHHYGRAGMTKILRQMISSGGLLVVFLLTLVWLFLPRAGRVSACLERFAWRNILRSFRLEVHVEGHANQGSLIAANHISWADIPVLSACGPMYFVAKAEMSKWPLLGMLAVRARCIFVDRSSRAGLRTEIAQLKDRLAAGDNVVLFPEGTTGPGNDLLPFHSSLFAGLEELGHVDVQPVAIRYLSRSGERLDPALQRQVAWLGDDSLLPHALELAAQGGFRVEVAFLESFRESDRKVAAKRSQKAISDWLAGDQAATLKRCA